LWGSLPDRRLEIGFVPAASMAGANPCGGRLPDRSPKIGFVPADSMAGGDAAGLGEVQVGGGVDFG